MKDFRDLKVWERAHQLTLRVYKVSAHFPREELFGLISQMRRCSASIGANIAEGCGKRGNNEFQRFPANCVGLGQRIGIPPFARP
jgi:four helix bundle protein